MASAPGGVLKTRIVYRVVLNFSIVEAYITRLAADGLLLRWGNRYLTTEMGRDYLGRYRELRALRASSGSRRGS